MANQTDILKIKIATDGAGKVKAELLGVSKGLDDVDKEAKKSGKSLLSLKTVIGGLSTGALLYFSQRALQAADDLSAMASRIGLTTTELQELDYVGLKYNVTQATMEMGLQRLLRRFGDAQRGIGEATAIFRDLGVSLYDNEGQLKSNEQIINDVADAIAGMDDEAAQLSATVKLVDSEAAGMVDVFRAGSDEIMRLRSEAHSLGAVMSEDVINKAAEANQKIEIFSKVLKTQFTVALTEVSPLLVEFGNWVAATSTEIRSMWDAADDPRAERNKLLTVLTKAQDEVAELETVLAKLNDPSKVQGIGDFFGTFFDSAMNGRAEGIEQKIQKRREQIEELMHQVDLLNGEIFLKGQEQSPVTNTASQAPLIDPMLLAQTTAELEAYRAQISATDEKLLTMQVRTKLQVDANVELGSSVRSLIASIIKEREEQQRLNQLKQEAAALTEQNLTPQQRYLAQQRKYNEMLREGYITLQTYNRAVYESREALEAAEYGQYFADLSEGVDQLKDATNSWASQFTDTLVDMAMTGKASFTDLANSIIRDMMRIAIQQTVLQPLFSTVFSSGAGAPTTGGGGGGANAPATMNGGLASGGHARAGNLYEVNEIRPEMLSVGGKDYLMMGANDGFVNPNPTRSNRATTSTGGATFNVNVKNVNNGTARVERATPNGTGGFDLDLVIDQVDSALAMKHQSGRSTFGQTLEATNGLSRVAGGH